MLSLQSINFCIKFSQHQVIVDLYKPITFVILTFPNSDSSCGLVHTATNTTVATKAIRFVVDFTAICLVWRPTTRGRPDYALAFVGTSNKLYDCENSYTYQCESKH
mmetsp:Transcript_30631/g.74639  ORF Transcript_30631/g.74639 Transcript_30631/m.74639 type:complete len:106 (+) Transcript_30631:110-427(+)